MRLYISPSMHRITISSLNGGSLIDLLRWKAVARHWSYRCIFYSLVTLLFTLPLIFIVAALFILDNKDCKTYGCSPLERIARAAGIGVKTWRNGQKELWVDSPAALAEALKAGNGWRSGVREDLPETVEQLVDEATAFSYDTATIIFKLKAMVELHEEKARVAKLQRALYRHFASKGVPKGLHCLSLRLTTEHVRSPAARGPLPPNPLRPRLTDNSLFHFVLISDNVLAASVVVASTVKNAFHREKVVFHVVTDEMTYAAMHAWFAITADKLKPAIVEVLGVHQMTWLAKANIPVLEQVQMSGQIWRHYFGSPPTMREVFSDAPQKLTMKLQSRSPKYISLMNHLRMYLPEAFPSLDKVVFLDDDVVVQKDLSGLWEIPLNGKVNGAVETCHASNSWTTSKRFKSYLNFSHPIIAQSFDPEQCAWAYGMNVFDLKAWRMSDVTQLYHHWQKQNVLANLTLWRLGTLPPALIAFDRHVEPIDANWHMLGLGLDQPEADRSVFRRAAVIHYNGPAKPWLDLAIADYKPFWTRYVDFDNDFIRQCNMFNL